ncbi:hypothetical protein KR093_004309 [Drosophila rubida]|uniref:Uncharacterized protein n=1 Tax=Drosophila rubida TaxID=30044 RepID=A0AAD4KAN8_9MUSC|nr:hypothetical protein KR093_004309 [Drosophila rubida]
MGEDAAAATTAAEAPKTTTSGALGAFQANAWLTAAAVAAYSTRALWLKMRNLMAVGKSTSSAHDDGDGEPEEHLQQQQQQQQQEQHQQQKQRQLQEPAGIKYDFEEPEPPGLIQTPAVSLCPI